ncbi:hypothetical protein TNCV_29781 [Trichonephila clavipes]|nr:hypothetical protein TNCV_29781 [Trichonephila clavipes]
MIEHIAFCEIKKMMKLALSIAVMASGNSELDDQVLVLRCDYLCCLHTLPNLISLSRGSVCHAISLPSIEQLFYKRDVITSKLEQRDNLVGKEDVLNTECRNVLLKCGSRKTLKVR